MPPIYLHMAMARDIARDLSSSAIEDARGTYLLGATSPDIRVVAQLERERTHFFNLDLLDHQDSVAKFFEEHPELRDAGRLNPESVAFISGYISHLVLDETWIVQVYRPYFGQLSALGGDQSANAMDRVLQYELDRRRREESSAVQEIRDDLQHSSVAVDVGFLDRVTLCRWLEVSLRQTEPPPDWEYFRRQAARSMRAAGIETEQDWDRFMETIPLILQRTIDHVSTAQVDAFLEQSTERARRAIAQYLGVAS